MRLHANQGEIDSSEAELQSREEEFAELQQTVQSREATEMDAIDFGASSYIDADGSRPINVGARAPAMSGMTRTLGATESQGIGLVECEHQWVVNT